MHLPQYNIIEDTLVATRAKDMNSVESRNAKWSRA